MQLAKLKFVKEDAGGALRATVGGVLLGTEEPARWLPDAHIQAVCYGGALMDGNQQQDAQDINGPLDVQIKEAARFVQRNRRVAAHKDPERRDVPQYSARAVFEAVVHRDYAVSGSHIRLFMFNDRLELYSPGGLGNSMQVEDLRTSQFTRNQLLASRLGQCPVEETVGAGERRYFIERRGEGIGVIEEETFALAGRRPVFELIGERELKLTLPAASPPLPEGIAMRVEVTEAASGKPLADAHVLALYPNKTSLEGHTNALGRADFLLHSHVPMTVFCAAPGYSAAVVTEQVPNGTVSLKTEGGSRWRIAHHRQPHRPAARHSRVLESDPRPPRPHVPLRGQHRRQRRHGAAGPLRPQRTPAPHRRPRRNRHVVISRDAGRVLHLRLSHREGRVGEPQRRVVVGFVSVRRRLPFRKQVVDQCRHAVFACGTNRLIRFLAIVCRLVTGAFRMRG